MSVPSRREVLVGTAGLAATTALPHPTRAAGRPPNVLFINLDEHAAMAASHEGNPWVRTPTLDRLVAEGTRFSRHYTADPSCCPARATWFTGRMSNEHGTVINGLPLRDDLPDLGQWVSEHTSHEPLYLGKWHIPGRNVFGSFRVLHVGSIFGEHCDVSVGRTVQGFLKNRSPDRPWFLTVSLMNPHDICRWITQHGRHGDPLPGEAADNLPELPPSFHTLPDEAALLKEVKRDTVQSRRWNEAQWRMYMWTYYRMTEMMDGVLGRIVEALDASTHARNTLLIVTSDHGDAHAHHRLAFKQSLYDPAARVPLLMRWPGSVPAGRESQVVTFGADVPATICDVLGAPPMPKQRGHSLQAAMSGDDSVHPAFAYSHSLVSGRMVRSAAYKYIAYGDDPVEQLFHLPSDPHELVNLAQDGAHSSALDDHRAARADWEARLESTPLAAQGWDAARAALKGKHAADD